MNLQCANIDENKGEISEEMSNPLKFDVVTETKQVKNDMIRIDVFVCLFYFVSFNFFFIF